MAALALGASGAFVRADGPEGLGALEAAESSYYTRLKQAQDSNGGKPPTAQQREEIQRETVGAARRDMGESMNRAWRTSVKQSESGYNKTAKEIGSELSKSIQKDDAAVNAERKAQQKSLEKAGKPSTKSTARSRSNSRTAPARKTSPALKKSPAARARKSTSKPKPAESDAPPIMDPDKIEREVDF